MLLSSGAKNVDEFLQEKWIEDASLTVEQAVSSKVATIGEKISIRRFDILELGPNGVFGSYIHGGGTFAVLLELSSTVRHDLVDEAAKNLSMQIAALLPKFVSQADLPQSFIDSEREIIRAATLNEEAESGSKKPPQVVEKMIDGRLNKQLKEICMLDQEYVKDASMTCDAYLKSVSKEVGGEVKAVRFVCYEKGEGIEKKEDNFAEEVSRMTAK
jgi:elongation factor Ts